ncbi:MAG: hypothetical protein JWO82_49, partial [Akkermansiaceae bacterium]|nr:hypothetical protein [Akkermansiaceae bacterium]
TAGLYTFGKNSDDGGRLKIDGNVVINDDTPHSPTDSFVTLNLSAGLHSFEILMFEIGGGDELEFFAAPGTYTSFDAVAFKLVGDVANGGLAASTVPPAAGGLIGTNLQSQMAAANGAYFRFTFPAPPAGTTTLSLMTRHNDGFAAWLNGTPVASDRAPASPAWDSTATSVRPDADSVLRKGYNLTAQLPNLTATGNVLAIQGLKAGAADTSFLLVPEISAASLDPALTRVFYRDGKATPGYLNGPPSSLGTVQTLTNSAQRGYYTSPVTVTLATPTDGVTIRYTIDGSTPSTTNGTVYTGPMTLSSTTVLRTIGVKTNWDSSPVDTRTYLFPADIIHQSPGGAAPPGWPSTSGTDQVLDFGMDPSIVNNANPDLGGPATVKSALLSLPAVSIVTDLPNLFDINGSQGIYAHPDGHGLTWERQASLEWINPPDAVNPNGLSQFQVNAGLRMRGGYSRSANNPKHSFRFFFRADYGASKLNYPLFGRRGAQTFDKIDIRTAQNYSWSFDGDSRNTFLREESSRQAMLDMGNPGSHVRYAQVFLNGQYWGLYNLDERTEADFAASYEGGSDDDWDVVKSDSDNGYQTSTTDGSIAAWQDLWNKSKAHRASPTNANYYKMMGLAADGVTPTADPVLLDPNNLIDYMLLTMWTGNQDGATSAFNNNERANNWFGSRRRDGNPRQGFRFFVHDFEHSMLDLNANRAGPFNVSTETDFNFSNPMFLHQDLTSNKEYLINWADRIQKHMFGNGALTAAAWQNRMNRFATVVDQSIAAESARWGDARHQPAYTRQDWTNAQNDLLNYVAARNPIVLNQLRSAGLYPVTDAPIISPSNPYQADGAEVTVSGPGTLYYMADGSDPRVIGGGVKSGALVYTPGTTQEPVVPWNASGWKYLADGSNQGTTWRSEAFNDSAWASGTAELGYGDGDEATVLPIVDVDPAAGVQKAATYYFRKTFDLASLAGISGGRLTVEYDDAYTVYLNGVRVASNLPANAAYNYYTGSAIEDTIAETSIDLSSLHAGTNTLAVEIHQASNTSTDVSMNCALTLFRTT